LTRNALGPVSLSNTPGNINSTMSTNAYVDEEKIRAATGFSETPYDQKGGGGINFRDISLFRGNGRLHAMLGDDEVLPAFLVEFVTDVSYYAKISDTNRVNRELGIYNHESAQAEVEIQSMGKDRLGYMAKVRGTKLEDCRELVRQIKAGLIRPTESYEGSQQGMSRQDLEKELGRVTDLVERQAPELEDTRNRLAQSESLNREHVDRLNGLCDKLRIADGRVRAAYKVAADLSNARFQWPWCSKQSIATLINCALNGADM
jgi:hypothetical protein